MTERRLVLLQVSARTVRIRDAIWIGGAAAAGLLVAIFAQALDWRGVVGVAALVCAVAYARLALGGRTIARRANELSQEAPAGLSLATAEALIERLPDPLLLLDAEGRLLFSNAATHGFISGSGLRRHVSTVLRAPGVLEAVDVVLGGGTAQSVEYSVMVPVERYMRAYVAPINISRPGSDHEERGAIILLHELTSQKRAEQMRADFVANASHELRTPLSSLSGFIDTLRGHARDDAVARERFLEIMSDQAGRMRRLIEDLLSLSRIELNEHVRPEGIVSLGDVVRDVLDGLAPLAASKKVKLEADIAPDVAPVTGARDELIQAVQNLVDNAIKYGSEGGHILVRAANAGEGESRAASFVAVTDFGEGIPREHLPRLTERFYRIDVQRSRQTGGTGLGLAIVKHIINRHRGWLSIESTIGSGSTFTIFLPQASAPLAAPPSPPANGTAAPQNLARAVG